MNTKRNRKPSLFVGDVYPSNNFGSMEVIEYISCKVVVVKFESGGITTTRASHIRNGKVHDPLMPSASSNKVQTRPIHIKADRQSGVAGITWCKRNNKWVLRLLIKGKSTNCGYFTSLSKAITHKAIVRLQELKRISPRLSINAQIDRLVA